MKPGDMPKLPEFITRFSWLDAALTAAILAVALGLTEWARWNALVVAFAVVFGAVFLISFAVRAARDMRPQPVPGEIADYVAKLEAAGFRRPRRHPWLCDEKGPHAHVIAPEGGGMVKILSGGDPEHSEAST